MWKFNSYFFALLLGIHFLIPHWNAFGAGCCAGGTSSATVITGDERTQLTATLSRSSVIGDAPVDGIPIFRESKNNEYSYLYQMDGATLVSDRIQVGASLPLIQRRVDRPLLNTGATGIGDIRLGGAYEFLPEWSYSNWRPKGFAYTQITLPTGRSIYSSKEASGVDAIGNGFYVLTVGALLTKILSRWDFSLSPNISRSFSRRFLSGSDSVNVGAAWGWSVAFGTGFSPGGGDFRLGLRLQPSYLGSRKTDFGESTATPNSQTSAQRKWDTTFELSYLLQEQWSLLSAYNDQTLIGPAQNTSLSRSFTVGVQRRWLR